MPRKRDTRLGSSPGAEGAGPLGPLEASPWRSRRRKFQAVALSSAAIAAIWAAGSAATRPELVQQAAEQNATGFGGPVPAALAPPARPGHYVDGSYTGTASNDFGDVEVTVRVDEGRIVSVAVTNWSMYYPPSYVAGLPAQVVARQSAAVDLVTAATASWQDFAYAVQRALLKAAGTPPTSMGGR